MTYLKRENGVYFVTVNKITCYVNTLEEAISFIRE